MDCDVMGCAFAFIKDLEDIDPRYNIEKWEIDTYNDNIEVYLELDNFNMTIPEIVNKIMELVNYHYGLVITSSFERRYIRIRFDFDYIYSMIGIYDDEESEKFNTEIYNEHKKAMRSIHDKPLMSLSENKPLDFPNAN